MKKTLLFKDKDGNKLYSEGLKNPKLAVRNAEGKLVNKKETHKFIRKAVRQKPDIKKSTAFQATVRRKKTAKTSHIFKVY